MRLIIVHFQLSKDNFEKLDGLKQLLSTTKKVLNYYWPRMVL